MAEMKIAIAEDNRQALDMLGNILESDKEIQVVGKAENGTDAYNMIVKTKPDIVFLDVVMPGMDGMETCEKLRQRYPEANVYMVSSMAYDDMIDRAVELGAKGFLFKPFTKDALLEGLQGAFKAIENEREKA